MRACAGSICVIGDSKIEYGLISCTWRARLSLSTGRRALQSRRSRAECTQCAGAEREVSGPAPVQSSQAQLQSAYGRRVFHSIVGKPPVWVLLHGWNMPTCKKVSRTASLSDGALDPISATRPLCVVLVGGGDCHSLVQHVAVVSVPWTTTLRCSTLRLGDTSRQSPGPVCCRHLRVDICIPLSSWSDIAWPILNSASRRDSIRGHSTPVGDPASTATVLARPLGQLATLARGHCRPVAARTGSAAMGTRLSAPGSDRTR